MCQSVLCLVPSSYVRDLISCCMWGKSHSSRAHKSWVPHLRSLRCASSQLKKVLTINSIKKGLISLNDVICWIIWKHVILAHEKLMLWRCMVFTGQRLHAALMNGAYTWCACFSTWIFHKVESLQLHVTSLWQGCPVRPCLFTYLIHFQHTVYTFPNMRCVDPAGTSL